MAFLKTLFTNCAHPQGRMGRAMLKFMNLCHAPLTNWGLDLVGIHNGWTMLDIGCGGGATLQRLLKRSRGAMVYGIDISEESVAKARKINADVLDKQVFINQGSAASLPYSDEMFDLVDLSANRRVVRKYRKRIQLAQSQRFNCFALGFGTAD